MFCNRVYIGGRLLHHGGLRHTPAGVSALQLRLAHSSEQEEAGVRQRIECEVDAVAFGDAARALAALTPGRQLTLHGFLARRSRWDDRLSLHVTGFELIEE